MEVYILIVLTIIAIALLLVILSNQKKPMVTNDTKDYSADFAVLNKSIENYQRVIANEINTLRNETNTALATLREDQARGLGKMNEHTIRSLSEMSEKQLAKQHELQIKLLESLNSNIRLLSDSNEKKLEEIRGTVSTKLDKTLNERIDSSFKNVSEQLGNLYRSLGELKVLSTGVDTLNKTLTNVKARGTWGEVQLGNILEQIMTPAQYERNVKTKRGSSDLVEFAIKFPSDDTHESTYLPIDSKFPLDTYNKIVEASSNGDQEELKKALSALKDRIKGEARDIRDKYLDPPRTTNIAIMFLPTEGLYAEALRIDGLSEECQKMGIMLSGPTTIVAILNSLQVGFKNIAISKKTNEVQKLLEAIKTQFGTLSDDVNKTYNKLNEAVRQTEKLQKRTDIINKRMRLVGQIEEEEAKAILPLEDGLLSEESYGDFYEA